MRGTWIALPALLATAQMAHAKPAIDGKTIKRGSITSKQVKDRSITGKDLKDGAIEARHLSATLAGAIAAGAKGAPGPAGNGSGDITAVNVAAGSGLTGGGSNGDLTLDSDPNVLQRRITPGTGLVAGGTPTAPTLGIETPLALTSASSAAPTLGLTATGTQPALKTAGRTVMSAKGTALDVSGLDPLAEGDQPAVVVGAAGYDTGLLASGGPAGVEGSGADAGVLGSSYLGTGVVGETHSGVAGRFAAGAGAGSRALELTGDSTIKGAVDMTSNTTFRALAVNNQSTGNDAAAVFGQTVNGYGLAGVSTAAGYAVEGHATGANGIGVVGTAGQASAHAGYFNGKVHVNGTLSKSAGTFKIDHPLDPANKTLSHSFVESPDMKNVYDGVVTTDRRGFATVRMPVYFSALNRSFRYQLTVHGRSFARAVVWQEMRHNRFVVRTSGPRVKLSWQVTGIRKDAYAEKHRTPVEQLKPLADRGTFLNPDVFRRSSGG